jgi:hypothetical protein
MLFNYEYFSKQLFIIVLLLFYFMGVVLCFGVRGVRKRNALFGSRLVGSDFVMFPYPDSRFHGHPDFEIYRAYFYSGFKRILIKSVVIALVVQTYSIARSQRSGAIVLVILIM